MKKYFYLLVLLIFFISSSSFRPVKEISISISDTNDLFIPVINGKELTGNLTLNDFKGILGEPSRIKKQIKGKRKCGGLGGKCGTKYSVPKRIFIYYDELGIELTGVDKNEIFAIKINFDTTGLKNTTLHPFPGHLQINNIPVNPASSLLSVDTYKKEEVTDDPVGCGVFCKLFKTSFKSSRVYVGATDYALYNYKDNSGISIYYHNDKTISRVVYYRVR